MTKVQKQQFTLRITQANKTGLVVILYEITLAFLEDALEEFEREDWKAYKSSIYKARDCLDELLESLNTRYEPGMLLRSLYHYYKKEITSAAILRNTEKLLPVMDMIRELKDSYEKIAEQDTSAPLMENTQTVYAGLTYGRGCLNENLADQGTDRGFRI